MTEPKAGDEWIGKAESPLRIKLKYIGDRVVVFESKHGGESYIHLSTLLKMYKPVPTFFEVGKVYKNERLGTFECRYVDTVDGIPYAAGVAEFRDYRRLVILKIFSAWTEV